MSEESLSATLEAESHTEETRGQKVWLSVIVDIQAGNGLFSTQKEVYKCKRTV